MTNSRPRITTTEGLMELARELTAFVLALILLVPAGFIHLINTISSRIITRRGGLD